MVTVNKDIKHKYTIIKTSVAGISLRGEESRAIRMGRFSFKGSYVCFENNEAVLKNFYIGTSHTFFRKFKSQRDRVLLMSKKEIIRWKHWIKINKATALPLSINNASKFIKVEVVLVKRKLVPRKKGFIIEKLLKQQTLEIE